MHIAVSSFLNAFQKTGRRISGAHERQSLHLWSLVGFVHPCREHCKPARVHESMPIATSLLSFEGQSFQAKWPDMVEFLVSKVVRGGLKSNFKK